MTVEKLFSCAAVVLVSGSTYRIGMRFIVYNAEVQTYRQLFASSWTDDISILETTSSEAFFFKNPNARSKCLMQLEGSNLSFSSLV